MTADEWKAHVKENANYKAIVQAKIFFFPVFSPSALSKHKSWLQ